MLWRRLKTQKSRQTNARGERTLTVAVVTSLTALAVAVGSIFGTVHSANRAAQSAFHEALREARREAYAQYAADAILLVNTMWNHIHYMTGGPPSTEFKDSFFSETIKLQNTTSSNLVRAELLAEQSLQELKNVEDVRSSGYLAFRCLTGLQNDCDQQQIQHVGSMLSCTAIHSAGVRQKDQKFGEELMVCVDNSLQSALKAWKSAARVEITEVFSPG